MAKRRCSNVLVLPKLASCDWWPLMGWTQCRITFFHENILSFTFADLKLQECSPKRLPITLVGFFYRQEKQFFSSENPVLSQHIFSLSLKERSLKIRVAEILGERKKSVIITYDWLFLSEEVWCVLWVFYLSIKGFSAAWIHKKWQENIFWFDT